MDIEFRAIIEQRYDNVVKRKLLYRIGDEKKLRELDITDFKLEIEDDIYKLADLIIQQYKAEQTTKEKKKPKLIGRRIKKKDVERWKAKKQQEEVKEWKTEFSDFSEL